MGVVSFDQRVWIRAAGIGHSQDFWRRAFPEPGDSGHVGIYLGYDVYISARTGEAPGSTGQNAVQPFSGVQIKEVPTDVRHVIIRHK